MQSLSDVWNRTLEILQSDNDLPSATIELWIKCIRPVSFDGQLLNLSVQSDFQKKIVTNKYQNSIQTAFADAIGFEKDDIVINISSDEEENTNQNNFSPIKNNSELSPALNISYDYTFKSFIVGSTNQFAHAACVAVSKNPGNSYNPLFIYGDSGLGKTHLLHAISAEVAKNFPNFNIVYVNSEKFTNEFIEALSNEKVNEFNEHYRKADILLVDDIQFLSGKIQTQEAFFHTFEYLHNANKQIVLTSDRPPKEIKTLEDRLRSRFEWGLIADIQAPDYETRIAIIKRKAELLNLNLETEVLEFIANKLKNNIRQLEGTVKNIKVQSLLQHCSPTISIAQNAIKDIVVETTPLPVLIDKVLDEVGKFYNVSPDDIRGTKRPADVTIARHVSMYIIRNITDMSNENIGKEFSNRHHSTVISAVDKIEAMMKKDSHFKNNINDLIKIVKNYNP